MGVSFCCGSVYISACFVRYGVLCLLAANLSLHKVGRHFVVEVLEWEL
jgi:hypothetical protein